MSDSSPDPNIVFLDGGDIALCPLEARHAEGNYRAWFNDAEVCAGNSHHRFPYTAAQAREFIAGITGARNELVLAIVERASGLHIGNVALQEIDPVNRSAEVAIVIGERSAWGKGYGKIACGLVIEHGFQTLNLERIGCGTFETNSGMIKVAESLGMREEGRRRKAVFKDGQYVDLVEFGILRHEFRAGQ